ncbi:hypothetical protein J437_LFUL001477 [Ladona fulva]|uniref:N-acetyltransferase domain-containing protein n=1 Tax=Ladona fulva TaxID=123851 RepID=A0A8K0K6F5_LADFU|nr:hypothetical protein J437_LFUL001477 [Ladona fulva]
MRLNSQTALRGKGVILLPYERMMVPKYHDWMKSPELLLLTASEPLTLEEEYDMQNKWLQDEDKCTFIVLDRDAYEKNKDEIGSMIGDTNLFLSYDEDQSLVAEAEIMIAEAWARGKRKGWEAMILMLLYGISELKVKKYQAKISMSNSVSINMFHKLGFKEESHSDVFKEVTLMKMTDEEWAKWLNQQTDYEILKRNLL